MIRSCFLRVAPDKRRRVASLTLQRQGGDRGFKHRRLGDDRETRRRADEAPSLPNFPLPRNQNCLDLVSVVSKGGHFYQIKSRRDEGNVLSYVWIPRNGEPWLTSSVPE